LRHNAIYILVLIGIESRINPNFTHIPARFVNIKHNTNFTKYRY